MGLMRLFFLETKMVHFVPKLPNFCPPPEDFRDTLCVAVVPLDAPGYRHDKQESAYYKQNITIREIQ